MVSQEKNILSLLLSLRYYYRSSLGGWRHAAMADNLMIFLVSKLFCRPYCYAATASLPKHFVMQQWLFSQMTSLPVRGKYLTPLSVFHNVQISLSP